MNQTMSKVLTGDEARTVSMILRGSDSAVARVQVDLGNGARIVLHARGGTIAVYGASNGVAIAGAGILQASEDYFSLADFEAAYAVAERR